MAEPPSKVRKLLHNHDPLMTLESAKLELVAVRARAAELEELVEMLEKEEDQKSPAVPLPAPLSSNLPQALQGPLLQEAMGWVNTKDRLSCIQTCRVWKNAIDQPKVWEQALLIHSPNLLDRIKASNHPSCCFKKVAIGSAHKPDEYKNKEQNFDSLPEPSLGPDDLFFLVEVRDESSGNVVVRWDVPFIENIHRGCQVILLHDEDDGDSQNRVPVFHSPYPGNLIVSCRLFRCDTNQSVGILFDELCYDRDYHPQHGHVQRFGGIEFNSAIPFANSTAGRLASQLWKARVYAGVRWSLECWSKECHDSVTGLWRAYIATSQYEMEFLSESEDPNPTFREFLIILDGWDWE